jgi:CBS domain-containing protein
MPPGTLDARLRLNQGATMTRRAVSLTDSPRRAHRPAQDQTLVREIMNPDVVTVRQDAEVASLAQLLLERGISRVPVLDEDDHLVGMVGMTDLVAQAHLRGDTNEVESVPHIPAGAGITYVPDGFHVHTIGSLVSDVMNRGVVSVPIDASVGEAARRLAELHLHGMPVVDTNGALVGFVSASDIVRWLAGQPAR